MYKLILLVGLAVVGARAQEVSGGPEAAPEPYSYGYETESHSAQEQRTPDGKVTGSYSLVDADGRQRRVDYIADEAGFRAKVQTNELGTKSENSADVEVLAAPPTEGQLIYQAPPRQQYVVAQQQQPPQQRVVTQQTIVPQQQQVSRASYTYVQQPAAIQYGYQYAPGYQFAPGYQYSSYLTPQYGYGYSGYSVGNYNNHLPSQYYKSISNTVQPASSYGVATSGGLVGRYVTTQTVGEAQPVSGATYRSFQSGVGVPAQAVTYQSSSSSGTVPAPTRGITGSSNYIVLKKK